MAGLNYAYKPAVLVSATTVFSNFQYYETLTNDMKFTQPIIHNTNFYQNIYFINLLQWNY